MRKRIDYTKSLKRRMESEQGWRMKTLKEKAKIRKENT